jgi:tetratricopeptide (TPR) repeat protein
VVKRDFEWDWSAAEGEFQKAIELNPGCVEAYHWRSTLLSMLGRHAEALREKKRALAMDPLSVVIRTDLARMCYFARDYDLSLEHYRSALAMDPNSVPRTSGWRMCTNRKACFNRQSQNWRPECVFPVTVRLR